MSTKSLWNKFWNPPGKGYLLFFTKFILFSVIGFLAWNQINDYYNVFLKNASLELLKNKIPLVDHRFTPERGQFELLLAPDYGAPKKTKKNENVAIKIYLNTVHFNLIPFFALIMATPFMSWKRLISFFLIGAIVLSFFHLLHINLDVKAYYHREQIRKGVLKTSTARMTQEQYQNIMKWLWMKKVVQLAQGFMEQAGSMLLPAFLWFIYASHWILQSLFMRKKLQVSKSG